MTNQFGAGKCSLCGSSGTSKATCPLNPKAKNPDPKKHPLAEKPTTTLSLLSNKSKSKSKSKSKVKPEKSKLLQLKGPGNVAKPSIKPPLNTMKIKNKTMKKSSINFDNKWAKKEGNYVSGKPTKKQLDDRIKMIKEIYTLYKEIITYDKDYPNPNNWGDPPEYCYKDLLMNMVQELKDELKQHKSKQHKSKSSNNFHRLEFKEGNSSKFWQIKSVGTDVETNWGKIGTKGSTKVMKFDSKDKANIYIEKQLQSKINKGYKEIKNNKSPMVKTPSLKQYAKFYNIIDKIDPDNDGYYIDDKYDNDKHFINVINGLKKTMLKDLKLGDILFVGNSGEGEGGFIMYLDNDIYYGENGYSGPIRYLKDCREGMGKEKECEKMKTIRYSKLVMDLQDNNPELYGFFGGDWLGLDDIKEEYEAVNLWD